jgi:NADPH:quinone reductase-like Zn-dependent oxidoreductase
VARTAPGDLSFFKGLIEAGELRTVIDKRYPLSAIAEAHRHAEAGHKKGHVIVLLGRP